MKESIAEMDEMETLRLEAELEKQRLSVVSSNSSTSNATNINNNNSKSSNDLHMGNRDSGITGDSLSTEGSNDPFLRSSAQGSSSSSGSQGAAATNNHKANSNAVVMRKSAINNSLLDLTDASEKMTRRGSVGSLDSGMSISFVQSGATPNAGSAQTHRYLNNGHQTHNTSQNHQQQHSATRVMNNAGNNIHPVVGACTNCMNPVSVSMGSNNHTSACYHHLQHHHHYHHHHHNLHLQPEYQHRHHVSSGRANDVTSSGNSSNHSSNTVASITSALL